MKPNQRKAFEDFHERRRIKILDYVEKCVADHVKSGGIDTYSYRADRAIDAIATFPECQDSGIWEAAWNACEEGGR
jgi:hypothetical protein